MNFFAAQEKAKKNTKYLIFGFILGVIFIVLCVNAIFFLVLYGIDYHQAMDYVKSLEIIKFILPITIVTLLIIFLGTIYKLTTLREGGKSVAESLGGRLVIKDGASHNERVLLNVVEEMSLASGISIPAVYLLEDESINAFAAGFSTDDVVIGVTKGAIEILNRQELQGVIAHEFSHIFNGDMNLNIKTTAWIHGILVLSLIGTWLLRAPIPKSSSSSKNKSGGIILVIIGIGIGLMVIGYVGAFIGNAIKAKISRQREYLADATAVKYTRDTNGIANALKKIGFSSSMIKSNEAKAYSHFFFAKGVKYFLFDSIFYTHPPLEDRILRIEPSWDGKYTPTQEHKEKKEEKKKEKLYKNIALATIFSQLQESGILKDKNIEQAKNLIDNIPTQILDMTKNPFTSQALILALLSSHANEVPQSELDRFSKSNPKLFKQILTAFHSISNLQEDSYLTILLLCIPSLKSTSLYQYQNFKDILLHWIWINYEIVFFEWILTKVVILPLDTHFGFIRPREDKYKSFSSVKIQISYFISFLATIQSDKPKELFGETFLHVELFGYDFVPMEELNFRAFDSHLETLSCSDPSIREKIMQMAIFCLANDGEVTPKNRQMLQALAITLRVPIPLLVQE